jgi:tRNA nucleotidyltransferase (CCA-adding enzyme)
MGMKAYLVGGMVRDMILGLIPNRDIDITVEGDGLSFARSFADNEGASYKGFEKFRTARIFLKNGFRIDVASARSEKYPEPGMLPIVELAAINQDLYRRDFTINAMAVRLNRGSFGELLDPFNGQADIKFKILKVLHSNSFLDDPTRILRFIRFKSRFEFSADELTRGVFEAGLVNGVFNTVSGERLRDELLLMLKERRAYQALKELEKCGALAMLEPGIKVSVKLKPVLDKIFASVKEMAAAGIDPMAVRLSAFLVFSGRAAASFLVKFKICNEWRTAVLQSGLAVKHIKKLSGKLLPGRVHGVLKGFGNEALYLLKISAGKTAAGNVERYMKILNKTRLSVTGHDLIKLGIKPGKKIGKILDALMEAKLNGMVHGKREELDYVRKILVRATRAAYPV